MANAALNFSLISDDGVVNAELENHNVEYTELARQRINVAPGASAIDVDPILAQLGVSAKAKVVAVISDIDGVVVNITTSAAETAVLGAHPLFCMSLEDGIAVDGDFAMTVELPAGDQTAHVDIVALG